jgi:Na+-translocating ferredoxin:NAD+ oxidoreductase RnfG subunit
MNNWEIWVVPPVLALASTVCIAETYLSVEQAQQALFPEALNFEKRPLGLTEEQRKSVNKVSKTRTPLPDDRVWEARAGERRLGWFIVDEVYGKHEYITYAAAIAADGSLIGIEVMEYRESKGGEVRDPAWRRQFVGKRHGDSFKLDKDITNISGATMSCKHLAEGAKRLLALHEQVLKAL